MPTEWQEYRVQDLIATQFSGPSPTCEERQIQNDSEWGLLKTTAVTWEHGWDFRQHKVLPSRYWHQPAIEVRAGDVIVTKAGPRHRVGVVAHIADTPPRIMVSGKMIGLRPDQSLVVPRILAAALSTAEPQRFLDNRTTGMAESQVNFSNAVILRAPLRIPPLHEQRRIAEILDTLDETIQKTEQVIAKLQLMKQGLLHDLLTLGLDDNGELRDPERHSEQFKESHLGLVPKDWSVKPLGQWLNGSPKNGYSPIGVDENTGVFMLGLGCLTPFGFEPKQLKNAPRNDPKLDEARLQHGDLLISRSNTRDLVGMAGIYDDIGSPCIYPDLMMRLRPSHHTSVTFLELLLRASYVRKQIKAGAVGTSGSMVKINASKIQNTLVAMPGKDEQEGIIFRSAIAAKDIEDRMRELKKLRHLKGGLRDDLLAGQIRIPQAETVLEQAM